MIQRLLKLLTLSFFALFFFIYAQTSYAASNFTTDYNVIYSVTEDGKTRSQLNITFTNTSSEYYVSSYKLHVSFEKIENVQASDAEGAIIPVIEKTEDGQLINLQFNKKAVGLGQKLNFTLSFDTPDVAKRYGKIWEINIPGVANPESFERFNVEVKVPPSFGSPTYIKPNQNTKSLIFNKDQLGKSGISIVFGDKQFYSFHLVYHIKNDNLYPIRTEIALPPNTNYQRVFIQGINPRPENVIMDNDKNWLAQFNLKASEKLDVVVDGKAEINLLPKQEELLPRDMATYLAEEPHWQTKADELRQLADELRTPEAIYNYVVRTLKYDFSRVTDNKPRLGALDALKNQNSAVCTEYTDLFIAIARAAGIPAREVEGFAYTENSKLRPLSLVKDILHAWPEYYDTQKKSWIMIDPTWGSTTGGMDYFSTLDFDHFAFVIKGVDSNYPIPAGGYKFITEKNTKDVMVDFAQNIPQDEINYSIFPSFPEDAMTAVPIKGKITVKNNSQNLILPQLVTVTSGSLFPKTQTLGTGAIPPFGETQLDVSFRPEPFLTTDIKSFKIRTSNKEIKGTIDISPLLIKKWWLIGGGIGIGILCISILIFAVGSRRL